jgi:hypothetical protein
MSKLTFSPLPEEEETALFEVLEDVFDNGGAVPEEPSSALLLMAIKQNYKQHKQTRNYVRGLEARIYGLGVGLVALGVIVIKHVDDAGGTIIPFLP